SMRRSGGKRYGQPYIPAIGPVLGSELLIGLHVEVALHRVRNCKYVTELRANSGNARFERAELRSRAAVPGKLLVVVADGTEMELLGQKVGGTPIEMGIDAVLIFSVWVLQVVREPHHR